jgi:hypothetical protein
LECHRGAKIPLLMGFGECYIEPARIAEASPIAETLQPQSERTGEETFTLSETSTLGDASTLESIDLSHTSGLNQSAAVLSRTASKRSKRSKD